MIASLTGRIDGSRARAGENKGEGAERFREVGRKGGLRANRGA